MALQVAVQREPQKAAGGLERCVPAAREAGVFSAGGSGPAAQPADRAPTQPLHQSTEVLSSSSSFLFFCFSFFFQRLLSFETLRRHSLRYLNVSANKMVDLPAASTSEDAFSRLEELYVTNNSLTDKCIALLSGHGLLKVLHLAYNQLQTFTAR